MNLMPVSRSLIKRNKSLYLFLQIACDNLLALSILVFLCHQYYGFVPDQYGFFIILLMTAMTIQYSSSMLYSMNASLTKKSLIRAKLLVVSFFILIMIVFITETSEQFSRRLLLILFLSVYAFQVVCHMAFLQIKIAFTGKFKGDAVKSKAIVVGTDSLAIYLCEKINKNPWLEQAIVGMVCTEMIAMEKETKAKAKAKDGVPILGCLKDLDKIIKEENITSVYLSVSHDSSEVISELYSKLLNENINVYWAPNIFSLNLINYHLTEISGIPIIALSETPFTGFNLLLKNIEDKVLSVLFMVLLSPVLLIISLLVKMDSPGSILFKQQRTGWDGKNFHIFKFRTMRVECCENGDKNKKLKQAEKNDIRVTRIGRFLRRTSLDELPQLFNVLEGSMSIIGPRPHAVVHNELFAKDIDNYLSRHRIKPGITGLAQVRGFRGEIFDIEEMEQRVHSDLEYINDWSITLDLMILFRTFFVIFKKNAY